MAVLSSMVVSTVNFQRQGYLHSICAHYVALCNKITLKIQPIAYKCRNRQIIIFEYAENLFPH
jgi:hypothetical protein